MAAAGLIALLLFVVGGAAGVLIALRYDGAARSPGASGLVSRPATAPGTATAQAGQSLAHAAATALPSVVTIEARIGGGVSEGSGVILRQDGTIITNNHVIAGAAGSITVTFADGTSAAASVVGRDPASDLAVIRATGVSGVTAARIGSSAGLRVGDTVLAIGSPLGLSGSVTAGIVSALHRSISVRGDQDPYYGGPGGAAPNGTIDDMIQTDTAINPGNSGGALVDGSGRVVGITTAIASVGGGYVGERSGSIGVGFAIPIDTAYQIATKIMAG